MAIQHAGHSVILFPALNGGWCFAEVDGASVYRFGPFDSHQVADELVSVLFPEVPRIELSDSSEVLDDSALMIRGNAERMTNSTWSSVRASRTNS
ncbi:hypothetical protein CupriaWKF_03565 [Cupriavidus sp. WKF15]|uniref:hypothetical protein n=1 Tax=Cupriavidus sp. WKF15 TaxID=3032282 RepID=UPI0023E0B05F|nr:hypothetical protein [Cupriavidus sp. WKF15]WER46671.1 hypothetical protein CupriaWKF_03565 [Cupriavidus sp. WKF15]